MRYRVVGNNDVLGHAKGEEFEARLGEVEEARLVSGGHLERVDDFEYEVPARTGKNVPERDADDPDEA